MSGHYLTTKEVEDLRQIERAIRETISALIDVSPHISRDLPDPLYIWDRARGTAWFPEVLK